MSADRPKIRAVFDCMIFLQGAARRESAAGACLRLVELDAIQLSQARTVNAIIVRVGFWHADDTKHAPSITKTFDISRSWLYEFTTGLFGFVPMRAVPSSWMAMPAMAGPT